MKILIDFTNYHVGALSHSVSRTHAPGQYAFQKEMMKLQKLAEKQLINMPEPEFDSARAEIEELWRVGIPFTKGRIGQYFWPAGTELMGSHGPFMCKLLRVIAQTYANKTFLSAHSAETKMRRVLSKTLHDDIGRSLLQ